MDLGIRSNTDWRWPNKGFFGFGLAMDWNLLGSRAGGRILQYPDDSRILKTPPEPLGDFGSQSGVRSDLDRLGDCVDLGAEQSG